MSSHLFLALVITVPWVLLTGLTLFFMFLQLTGRWCNTCFNRRKLPVYDPVHGSLQGYLRCPSCAKQERLD